VGADTGKLPHAPTKRLAKRNMVRAMELCFMLLTP
jgi:hypothetical protein